MKPSTLRDHDQAPRFWRDPALPFIEARAIADGRKVCYSRHAHEHFSIGAITAGQSTYISGNAQWQVAAGTVVLMNPGTVHACNPIDDQPWSYCMFYIDTAWLTALQHGLGFNPDHGFCDFSATHSQDPALYDGLNALYERLIDEQVEPQAKHAAIVTFFTLLHRRLNPASTTSRPINHKLEQAAVHIREHCTETLRLDEICEAAGLSPSYLIRAFKQHYGMTPHAYLVNQRVQYAQQQLRQGRLIADVALLAGFADQAHLQRAFKQHLAATPGQYRG